MTNRSRRNINKDGFIFTNNLSLIKPYVKCHICIGNFISRFGPNDVIIYNKDIGFALIQYNDFCPINILDDPYCLDFIYINKNQRGKGHGKRLMRFILKHFQIVLHVMDSSLGFFEYMSKDLGSEKMNTGMPFGVSFVSSNLDINRQPVFNSCVGGCGRKFSGYKRYVCFECSMVFVRENINMDLIRLYDSLRSKLRKEYKPCVIAQISMLQAMELLSTDIDEECKKSLIKGLLWYYSCNYTLNFKKSCFF